MYQTYVVFFWCPLIMCHLSSFLNIEQWKNVFRSLMKHQEGKLYRSNIINTGFWTIILSIKSLLLYKWIENKSTLCYSEQFLCALLQFFHHFNVIDVVVFGKTNDIGLCLFDMNFSKYTLAMRVQTSYNSSYAIYRLGFLFGFYFILHTKGLQRSVQNLYIGNELHVK